MPRLTIVLDARGGVDEATLRRLVVDLLVPGLDAELVVAGDVKVPDDLDGVRAAARESSPDPRNAAVAGSRSQYLAFVAPDTGTSGKDFSSLVGALDVSGSDLAVLSAPDGERRTATNLRSAPELVVDRPIDDKVWRRDFWERTGLHWPEQPPRDDVLVTVGSLASARTVDVVPRDEFGSADEPTADERTVRARAADLAEAADRLEAAGLVGRRLATAGLTDAHQAWARDVALEDVRWAVANLSEADEATQHRIVDAGAAVLEQSGPDIDQSLRAIQRLKYHLLRRRLGPELLEVVKAEQTGELRQRRPVRRGLRYYGDYPFRGDRRLAVPAATYRLDKELALRAYVDDVHWKGDRLHVEGVAHIALLDVSSARAGRLRLELVPRNGPGPVVPLPVQRVRRRDVTAAARESGHDYDWSGFRTTVDLTRLRDGDQWRPGVWRLRVHVARGGVRRTRWVTATTPGRARRPGWLDLAEGVRVVPTTADGRFMIAVERPSAVVDEVSVAAGQLTTAGTRLPGDERFSVTAPVAQVRDAEMLPAPEGVSPADLRAATGLRDLVVAAPDGSQLAIGPARDGRIAVCTRPTTAVVTDVDWPADGPIRLTVQVPGDDAVRVLLRAAAMAREEEVPAKRDGDRLLVSVDPHAVPTLAGPLPLAQGTWEVTARTAGGPLPVTLTAAAASRLPLHRTYGVRPTTLLEDDDRLRLLSGPDLTDDERGAVNQRRLQRVEFPAFVRQGLRDEVLFESYQSRAYADNARAVYEELHRRETGLTCRWVVMDGQTVLPDELEPVRHGSSAHYESLARARYVVVPSYRPLRDWLTTPEEQIVVQTWHGAPFKRIGLDNERGERASSRGYIDALRRETARWNYLLSPNPPSTPILRRAFAYDGTMLETGYPRCDLFFRPDREAVARRVRHRLGLPEGKTVVLYAPTMRDDHRYSGNRLTLDLRLDLDAAREALADDHVLLIRRHARVVDTVTAADGDFARDVSLWPDVNELLLATDVLVTDYSSLLFDFANTGRPMLFFTYDLDDYRDRLRGFYFDVDRLPGPLLRTSDEVVAAIRDAAAVRTRYDAAYRAFVAEFCAWDDGGAAARFVDAVFTGA